MINKVILLGNVGKDPEVKTLESGDKIANLTIATSETYKDKQGKKVSNTEWHKVSVFGKIAEIVEMYVKKGQQLYIEGKIKTRSWDDKDGNKKYSTEIVISGYDSKLQMLGKSESKQETNDPF
jgi:single-strand DNA-binding protein